MDTEFYKPETDDEIPLGTQVVICGVIAIIIFLIVLATQ